MQATITSRYADKDQEIFRWLSDVAVPPNGLYVAGTLPDQTPVAIVGSRKPTPYGRRVAATIASRLASHGVPIVSGLAFGIDKTAHAAALDAGGRTIAVLPSGLDDRSISPQSHLGLAKRIVERGALLSEYPTGTTARKEHYLARNRLISGLARAVVVVEAAVRSGSMTTARWATDQGRDVWAVPGPIDSLVSGGTNQLIRDGANPLVSVDDFLEALGVEQLSALASFSSPIMRQFTTSPTHLDTILQSVEMPSAHLEREITRLELAGVIRHVGGRYYVSV